MEVKGAVVDIFETKNAATTFHAVNTGDVSSVKARSGPLTSAVTFRYDVNPSGAINAADVAAVKARAR